MKRFEKQQLIQDLQSIFANNKAVVVVHYKGLTVSDLESLRKEVYQVGAGFRVVKNNLASIAAKETNNNVIDEFLVGPTAIVFGNDPVSSAKTLVEFSKKKDKLVILGGAFDSSKLSAADVNTLATLPSFDELRGKIVGLLVAAATKLAVIARTPATNVIGVLEAYSKK